MGLECTTPGTALLPFDLTVTRFPMSTPIAISRRRQQATVLVPPLLRFAVRFK